MFEYLVGKIIYKNDKYVILESNFKGYKIFVNDTCLFEQNVISKLFVFIKITQNNKGYFGYEYYGFKTLGEKIFFEILLGANGVGPKIAMSIMQNDLEILRNLIVAKDINALLELKNMNFKIASNLCNQIAYKLNWTANKSGSEQETDPEKDGDVSLTNHISEITSALKSLGYKKNDISHAINSMNKNFNNINDAISEAIKIIVSKSESITAKA